MKGGLRLKNDIIYSHRVTNSRPAMNSPLLETANTQVEASTEQRRHKVDPRTPEFTHELMRCFNEARQIAIREYLDAQASQASDQETDANAQA